MSKDEIIRLDVIAGLSALTSGALSSSEYCAAALAQLRKFESQNIFTQVSETYIQSHASSVDSRQRKGEPVGELHGLPYALKDSVDMVEYYTIAGHPRLREFRPRIDADLVKMIRDADGVCIGKTQIPPLSLWWTTENPMTGDTGNPFNSRYKTGGSSGGSGAAVAARIVPFAIAEDTGGSVRVPAAMNGVQGLRPTTGRWPIGGAMPIGFSDTLGPIARSVADIKLLDTLFASDRPQNLPGNVNLADVRFGVQKEWFLENLHPWVEANFDAALEKLSRSGAKIVEVSGLPGGELYQLSIGVLLADMPTTIAHYFNRHGVYDVSAFELMQSLNVESIKNTWLPGIENAATGEKYFELVAKLNQLRERSQAVFEEQRIDALLFPTSKVPNTPNDGGESLSTIGPLENTLEETAIGANMLFAPATKRPSISIFSGMDQDGLPLSVTLDGVTGQDRRLLDIAEAVEAVLPPLEEPNSV
ncbi:MAG: amidase family protein [Woeseiaceae bacterium]|nr:amidase family protein [Woeseiaceae bacterium]